MASLVYLLGAIVTATCAILLLRGFARSRGRLLLWSGLCFAGLTVSNSLLFVDLQVIPEVNLYMWRLATASGAMLLLVLWRLLEVAFGYQEESDDTRRWRKRATSTRSAPYTPVISLSRLRRRPTPYCSA